MAADGDADSAAASAGAGAGQATVHIRCSNGSKFSLDTDLDATISSLKAAVASRCDIPADQQRLIYRGRILKDDQTLRSYGVESDHAIHLVRGVAPATENLGASSAPNNTSGVSRGAVSNEGGGFGGAGIGGSLFPGLGVNGLGNGEPGIFRDGFPEFGQVQQQLTQNPNMMREMMNMPVVQNLMNNPELMRNLIMSNPQMRELLDRNPDLAHVLNDPSTLRQTLEAARNPELMREMMRNTDRAMSNIESSPEGFNMLRRMYETVQGPLLNATTMAGDEGNGLGTNPFAALLGNQGTTQLRDRSANPSTTGSEATTGSPAPNTNPLPNPWSNSTTGTQTTNTRLTPTSEARTTGISGLARLGLPELSAMPDPSLLNQFMQNPAVAQMMQSFLSNPENLNQILGINPQLRSLLESNPQLRETLASPEMLQQLLAVNQSILAQLGRQQSGQEQNQTGGAGLEFWMNMLGAGAGAGSGNPVIPNASNVPPEELYATQLSQLQEMGFFDAQENIRALSATQGNVHAAVERLLGNPGL